jgi:predicted ATPase/signal transduction histidine kinase
LYLVTETLAESSRKKLLRGVRGSDRLPVVLKVLSPRHRPIDLERLNHEYEIGSHLAGPPALRYLALDMHHGLPALVMEDFGGLSLSHQTGDPLEVGPFLQLAVRITAAVSQLHLQRVVHRDLNPANILIHPRTGEIRITDFELAERLPEGLPVPGSSGLIEGSLPYMSPEQTGRTNRPIDQRSDLYSLGVTFYELLTGTLPFRASDPLEWIHCHIAAAPIPPAERRGAVPAQLSAVVMKLLSKKPEDRYQSAAGLQHDLETCLAQWESAGRIEQFALGTRDVSAHLRAPQRLYGREKELADLQQVFERVVKAGAAQLLLVSGDAGIGKSSLIRELRHPIRQAHGLFVAGKFDQYRRDVPYSTLEEVFRDLVLEILTGSEEQLAAWRGRLQAALGVNAQLMVDVIPPLELIIGPQPPAPEVPLPEAQSRFRSVFRSFIGVFARQEHPLVLFLDDLQWADAASLLLLRELTTQPDVGHIFVVGACRDNEVTPFHPLAQMLDEIRQAGARVFSVVLGPLPQDALAALIGDTLHCSAERAAPLAGLLLEKTGGNPFFAWQFLNALREEKLLFFDPLTGAWQWDLEQIQARQFTDNVADLMIRRLERLSDGARESLQLLACVGTASLRTLALVLDEAETVTKARLQEAERAGLVRGIGASFSFLHDRVQEAAYALIPEADRPAFHLRVGRHLIETIPAADLPEQVFAVVSQLNPGAALLTPDERQRLSELNLMAGRRANASAAEAAAASYLSTGISLLPSDFWNTRATLAFELHLEQARCELLAANYEEARTLLARLRDHARTRRQIADVACAEMMVNVMLGDNLQGVEIGLTCLRHFGIEWPAHPTWPEVLAEYERLERDIGPRTIEELANLPLMVDPDSIALMDVLVALKASALFTDGNLHCLLACRMATTSIAFGNTDASTFGHLTLALALGPFFGRFHEAYRFARLGHELVERSGLIAHRSGVYLDFALVSSWMQPLRTVLELLQKSFDAALEVGTVTHACYARKNMVTAHFARGSPLSEVLQMTDEGIALGRRARFGLIELVMTSQQRLILNLQGRTDHFSTFSSEAFEESRYEALLEANRDSLPVAICWYQIHKLMARYLSGDFQEARRAADKAVELLWTSPSFMEIPEYHYFRGLTAAALFDRAGPEEQDMHRKELREEVDHFRQWSENCPETFEHRHILLAAELARIEAGRVEAMDLYERAIKAAGESGFVQDEALANELAARFYRGLGADRIADACLREARACYVRWGADGKVKQLDRLHPQLPEVSSPSTSTFTGRVEELDVLSVTKASQAISRELDLDSLLGTLVRLVIEHAGARKGYVLLLQDDQVTIGAQAYVEDQAVTRGRLAGSSPELLSSLLPLSIVNYVRRTRERVLLDDALKSPQFGSDGYIIRVQPRSLLCLPILRQAELIGLLYLENDLVTGAFTANRLAVLELLASQAAISLESALLLARERAARKAAEDAQRRTAFLAEASALLGESLQHEEVLGRLASLAVRDLADWCSIDLLVQGGIQRVAGAHRDPERQALFDEYWRRFPPGMDSPHPTSVVQRTGQPLLIPDLDDVALRPFCLNEEHFRLIRRLGGRTGLAVPLIARGEIIGAMGLVSDQPGRRYDTADLEMAQELARRAAIAIDNARLYQRSEAAIHARDEFLSVASHELRTPIQALQLMVQGLTRGLVAPSPEKVLQAFVLVERQVGRLTRLVEELLSVSRLESGRLELHLEPVDLEAVVSEVAQRFQPERDRSGSTLSIRADAFVGGLWDPSWIDHIVTNLLANAFKFGAGKPIEVSIDENPRGTARLVVIDHGIGIPPERIPRLFHRFERAVSAREYGGLGLGLYIVRRAVETLGGIVRVERTPGSGSTFTVELPSSTSTGREDRPAPRLEERGHGGAEA